MPPFGTLDQPIPTPDAPKATTPFRIAVLGDFSGRGSREKPGDAKALLTRKPIAISRDDFDDKFAALGVALKLRVNDEDLELSFASLDELHPDDLHDKIDAFSDLNEEEDKTKLMRAVLHEPRFQALEAAWRGLDWLLRRAQKSDQIQFVLYDVTFDEFIADFRQQDDLTKSAVHQLLIDKATQGPKGQPWTLLVGLYTFELATAHLEALGRMARIAARASAPFLSAIHSQLLTKPDKQAGKLWEELRSLPEATSAALAMPGILLRLPYGESTKSIDRFSFEEFPEVDEKQPYLWGNAALAVATLFCQTFMKDGWKFRPGSLLELTDLVMHTYKDEDGERQAVLTQQWINTMASQGLVKQGFLPLLPVKGRDQVQLACLQSIAHGGKPLVGRWQQATETSGKPTPRGGIGMKVAVGIGPGKAPPPASEPTPEPAAGSPAESTDTSYSSDTPTDYSSEPTQESTDYTPTDSGSSPDASSSDAPVETGSPDLDALLQQLGQ
jgi:type VI secretion system protein ImpC